MITQAQFRKIALIRLKITKDKDVENLKRVTAEEAAAFDNNEGGPQKDDAQLALLIDESGLENDWNWAVGTILIEEFFSKHPGTPVDEEFLRTRWLDRLISLKRCGSILENVKDKDAYFEAKSKSSRRTTNRTSVRRFLSLPSAACLPFCPSFSSLPAGGITRSTQNSPSKSG
jgi:hypothetical protein